MNPSNRTVIPRTNYRSKMQFNCKIAQRKTPKFQEWGFFLTVQAVSKDFSFCQLPHAHNSKSKFRHLPTYPCTKCPTYWQAPSPTGSRYCEITNFRCVRMFVIGVNSLFCVACGCTNVRFITQELRNPRICSLSWPAAMPVSSQKHELEHRKWIKLFEDFWVACVRFDFAPRRRPRARSM